MLETKQYKIDSLLKRDIEAGHSLIGNWKYTFRPHLQEKWNDRTPATQNVAVADDGEFNILAPFIVVCGNEKFI